MDELARLLGWFTVVLVSNLEPPNFERMRVLPPSRAPAHKMLCCFVYCDRIPHRLACKYIRYNNVRGQVKPTATLFILPACTENRCKLAS